MKRISTSSRAQDLFGPGKDGFKDGNLATGQAPTAFQASWCNHGQEEVANVVEASGQTLDDGDYSQLLKALSRSGVFQTPPFDESSTRIATTAWVRSVVFDPSVRVGMLRFPDGDTQNSVLPAAAARSNKLLGFDAPGGAIVVDPASLSVGHAASAATAANAGHANSADSATNATNASHATNADNAGHANSADSATNAGHANNADNATNAGTANNANNLGGTPRSEFVTNGGSAVQTLRNNGTNQMLADVGSGNTMFWGATFVSDLRVKKNIEPASEDSLAKICLIEFKSYRVDSTVMKGADERLHKVGFIAQQVEQIDPDWIIDDRNLSPYKHVNDTEILFSVLHAVQQLGHKNAALEARVAALEANQR